MKKLFQKFSASETGAITIEVLAMGGVIVVFGVFALAGFSKGVEQLEEDTGYQLREQDKITTF